MTDSIRNIKAMILLKTKIILHNANLLIIPIFSILLVIGLKYLVSDADTSAFLGVSYGFSFNVILGGILFGAYPLAEDKEKNTLRSLMTSSITAGEYIIGTIVPIFLIIFATNILVLLLSDLVLSSRQIAFYLMMSIICIFISVTIGFIVGLISKNQTQAGIVSLFPTLLIMVVPTISIVMGKWESFSSLIFSYPISEFLYLVGQRQNYDFSLKDFVIPGVWLVLSMIAFILLYRRNGID